MAQRILVGVPRIHHVLLSQDEIDGFKELGYNCQPVTYTLNDAAAGKVKKVFGVIARAFRMVKALYAFKPQILYLNSRFEPAGGTRDFITLMIVKLFYYRKLKVAIKTHGSDISLLERTSFYYSKVLIPFLRKNVDAWFFLSSEEKETVRKLDPVIANKIFVTANIIDPGRSVASAAFREKYALEEHKFKVLFAGRIVREKGVFALLQSIPLLSCKDNCQFVFVGDGPHLQELKQLAEKLQLTAYTRFPGFVPDHECDHFYANADMLAFPTYDNEGFPMALFKSVAAGLPVITTRIRAAKDHLTAPDNVLWVDKESAESIATAVETLYNDHALRQVMAENNRQIAKRFTRTQVCAGMHEAMMSINHS